MKSRKKLIEFLILTAVVLCIASTSIIIGIKNEQAKKQAELVQSEIKRNIDEISALLDSIEDDVYECGDIVLSLRLKARIMDSLLVQIEKPPISLPGATLEN